MSGKALNATAASLLGFLHEGPMTGWDLVATAEQRIGDFWSLTRSQVYRELAAMAEAGLIEAGEPGRRERVAYTLTEAGRNAFAGWVAREPGPETIRFPLLLAIVFGQHLPPGQLAAIVGRHRAIHAARLAEYEQTASGLPPQAREAEPYRLATLDFGRAYERAVLDWFDGLPETIRGREPWPEDGQSDAVKQRGEADIHASHAPDGSES
jgi:DNA-binding PadR family transcriptional regulator